MAGHSKWANIKHRKQSVDAKRSKEFQKISKEIKNALVDGIDPKKNSKLRLALARARSVNMPNQVIDRCLNSFEKQKNSDHFFWIGGQFSKKAIVLIQANHSNKISAINDIKKVVQKSKLHLLQTNSLLHFFNDVIAIELEKISEEDFLSFLDKFDIFDTQFNDQKTILYFKDKQNVKEFRIFINQSKFNFLSSFQTYLPLQKVECDLEDVQKYFELKEKLLTIPHCVQVVANIKTK